VGSAPAAAWSELTLPMGIAGLLLTAGLVVFGSAWLRRRSRTPHDH
jgi:hypothetical protein